MADEADDSMDELGGPVDELRRLYERLQPPELADDLAAGDAETARVVGWMRGAWRELEAPRAATLVLRPLPRKRAVRPLLVSAAAAVLLLAGAALWRALAHREPGEEVVHAPSIEAGAEASIEAGVEILDVGPDHVELRSGPVRLVLLGPPDSPRSENPPGG